MVLSNPYKDIVVWLSSDLMKSSGELENLSLTIKSMFCKREKVPVSNVDQQNDKSTQEFL